MNTFKPGDRVIVLDFNLPGIVAYRSDKGYFVVAMADNWRVTRGPEMLVKARERDGG